MTSSDTTALPITGAIPMILWVMGWGEKFTVLYLCKNILKGYKKKVTLI